MLFVIIIFFYLIICISEVESDIRNHTRMLASKSKCEIASIESYEDTAKTRG